MFDDLEGAFIPQGTAADYSDLQAILYHYSDAAGLIGMLSANEIWATEHRYLNDRSEIEHTRTLVRGIISERMTSSVTAVHKKLYAAILSKLERPQHDTEVYFFSLSEQSDSLSQWRGYSKDGCGFTVGFDAKRLADVTASDEGIFGFCKVEYCQVKQRDRMKMALDAIEHRLASVIVNKTGPQHKCVALAASSFDTIVWNLSVANKHASFESEAEWRIFYFAEGQTLRRSKVRARGNKLIPYMPFSAKELGGKNGKLPIRSIGVGPGHGDISQLRAVEGLTRQCGYKVEFYAADAPYRAG